MPRTTYRNGDPLDNSLGGCDECRVVVINGVFCHETGCPARWKDYKVECFECGGDFYPVARFQKMCDDCSNYTENDESIDEEDEDA